MTSNIRADLVHTKAKSVDLFGGARPPQKNMVSNTVAVMSQAPVKMPGGFDVPPPRICHLETAAKCDHAFHPRSFIARFFRTLVVGHRSLAACEQ